MLSAATHGKRTVRPRTRRVHRADAQRIGRFESAHGGTLLLDEISEIDLRLQAKLLRVLQEKSFERVGSSQTIRVDVRVLATTNRDLQPKWRRAVSARICISAGRGAAGRSRPCAKRREDIPELCDFFFARCASRLQREPCTLDASARQLLLDYHWPGNVRELENIVTRASILLAGPASPPTIRRWLIARRHRSLSKKNVSKELSLEEMERKLIESTLERFGGHRAKTAEVLGIGLRTLSGKLRQYGYAPREKIFQSGITMSNICRYRNGKTPRFRSITARVIRDYLAEMPQTPAFGDYGMKIKFKLAQTGTLSVLNEAVIFCRVRACTHDILREISLRACKHAPY